MLNVGLLWAITYSLAIDCPTICGNSNDEWYTFIKCSGRAAMWSAQWVNGEDGELQSEVVKVAALSSKCYSIQRKSSSAWFRRSKDVICVPYSSDQRCLIKTTRIRCSQ